MSEVSVDNAAVLEALRELGPEIRQEAMKGLSKAGMNIIADAQTNLRANTSVVTGLLRQSGKVQKAGELDLDCGFFDTSNKGIGYAYYVENGRRAGKWPPIYELVQWCRKKLRMDEKSAQRAGFLMARRIGLEGTTPHPFFGPAVQKNRRSIEYTVMDAINRIIDR